MTNLAILSKATERAMSRRRRLFRAVIITEKVGKARGIRPWSRVSPLCLHLPTGTSMAGLFSNGT